MITEQPDYDLLLLAPHFTTCGDYDKEVILKELYYWKKTTDFLVLISGDSGNIDGFLIGYRSRNSLWLAQVWRKVGSDWATSVEALNRAKAWAKERGMISVSGETDRKQIRATERYGFKEESVNMKAMI